MSGRILVVDDIDTNRAVLSGLLKKKFFEVVEARSGEEALEIAKKIQPDIALLDVMMPGMNGFDVCRILKADPALCDIPVIMVTTLDDAASRRAGIEAGADDFLTKPIVANALFARIRSLLRMKAMTDELRMRDETIRDIALEGVSPQLIEPPENARVIGLTDPASGDSLRAILEERLSVKVAIVHDAAATWAALSEAPPEAVLVDSLGFPEFLPDFCTALRQRQQSRSSAIIALLDANRADEAAPCLDAGANDYVMHPIDPSELSARLRTQLRHKAYADHLRSSMRDGLMLAVTDPLTGLRNRRYLDMHLGRMMEHAKQSRAPLALLAFDLDRFKTINDTYGHAAGDAVLKEFSNRLDSNTRGVDLIARIGGEEFLVAMPDAGIDDARVAAERVRRAVETPGFQADGVEVAVTVSVGVAALRRSDRTTEALIARADAALYRAKHTGRNRVILEAA
jgi:two-component system cell cycle response regulator